MLELLKIIFAILMYVALMGASYGCITDPSQWRPDQHMLMARSCRVVCYPGAVKRYDSMDGSCECRAKGVK